ncbi:enolase C-terminal domain-like protein [Falsirhodobacter halotolerans]|uniref:enolase C-terminal domain-like protein n=1 Tax=Falsirhodobacter halotolerans TaxID=1146892 RepID=UPI001FD5D9CE|nr:enolase C-terminal domain-like protein [Falsirhodobacter halotolerans]MCJ8141003.1 muconate cycloisomerase [Falsirhodobacter halotolerans]
MTQQDVHSDGIAALRVFLVESPIKMARQQGVGHIEGTVKRVLLELTSRDGITGWGEAAPWEVFTGTPEAAFAALDLYLRPIVMGWPLSNIRGLTQAMDRALVGHHEAKLAVEMAMFDILGKRCGLSVAELLGGRVRDSIPLSFSIADPDFDKDLERMHRMVPEGNRIYKVKTGVKPHAKDMAHLDAIRAAFGTDVDIRLDYNQALSPFGAMQVLRDVEQFAPSFIEQPVPRDALTAMAEFRRKLDTPILADESCFDMGDLRRLIELKAADAISVKLMKVGGMLKGQALMGLADAARLPGYGGTLWEGGIALAAGTQFIAATPGMSLGCEFYMPHHVLTEDVLEARIENRDGAVIVPKGPGLGITITEHSLRDGARRLAQA